MEFKGPGHSGTMASTTNAESPPALPGARRGSPRIGSRPDRRRQVLDGATTLFSQRPFHDITIADVAKEAGLHRVPDNEPEAAATLERIAAADPVIDGARP
jgi:Bacterial regulatory proteins, tetR family